MTVKSKAVKENKMPQIAKLLGVYFNTPFLIQSLEKNSEFFEAKITYEGLRFKSLEVFEGGESVYLTQAIRGLLEIKRCPWTPKEGEEFIYPDIIRKTIACGIWYNAAQNLALLKLGVIHKTKEEAMECLPDDYEKLTGKKFIKD